MDAFNHLAVLISIVLGLGITQLLSGFARWLEQRGTFEVYTPSILWAAVLLVMHVQAWWAMFGMREHADWTFLQFGLVLLQPIIMFLLSALVLPSQSAPEQDLRRNYQAQRTWFFGLLLGVLVVSVLKDLSLNGSLPEPLNLGFHIFLFVATAIAMATKREAYHRGLAYASVVFVVTYILVLFAELA